MTFARFLNQVRATSRKNLLQTYRDKTQLRSEVLPVLLMAGVLLLLGSISRPSTVREHVVFSKQILMTPMLHSSARIGVTSTEGGCPAIFAAALNSRYAYGNTTFVCFDTEAELEGAAQAGGIEAAFVLSTAHPEAEIGRRTVTVAIRLPPDEYGSALSSVMDLSQFTSTIPGLVSAPSIVHPFLAYQLMAEHTLIAMLGAEATATVNQFTIRTQHFPIPSFLSQASAVSMKVSIPIYLMTIFTSQLAPMLQRVLEEKEKKIKELMRMAGLSDIAYWTSWIVASAVKGALLTVLLGLISSVSLFPNSDLTLIVPFFFLFHLSITAYGFAMSAFFRKARVGVSVSTVLLLVGFAPAIGILAQSSSLAELFTINDSPVSFATGIERDNNGAVSSRAAAQMVLCLLSPSAFLLGSLTLHDAEASSRGLTWQEIDTRFSSHIAIPFHAIAALILADAILYFVLAWYLDKVVPQEFGVARHPLFCLRSCQRQQARQSEVLLPPQPSESSAPASFRESEQRTGVPASPAESGAHASSSPSVGLDALRHRRPGNWDGTHADGPVESLSGETHVPLLKIQGITRVFRNAKPSSSKSCFERIRSRLSRALASRPTAAENGVELGSRSSAGSARFSRTYRQLSTEEGDDQDLHVSDADILAVDNLWLSVYEGHITGILGHNGSGKSTLVSLVAGFYGASAGDAYVNGHSICQSPDEARRSLAVCPQHDVLYDSLTPRDHLMAWAGLYDMDASEGTLRANELMDALGLLEKADVVTRTLSGGQKRKLCVAMALIGDAKVVLLDEPSSGMDAASRRLLWTVLERSKRTRAIGLLTHDMTEAELLCDRVAVMSKGRLRIAGSPLFLKSSFNLGYTLAVSHTVADAEGEADECDEPIRTALCALSPSIRPIPVSSVRNAAVVPLPRVDPTADTKRVAFSLPLQESPTFPGLFAAIEAGEGPLGRITAYELAMTSLEAVFLKLSEEEDCDEEEAQQSGTSVGASGADVLGGVEHAELHLQRSTSKPSLWNAALLVFLRRLQEAKRAPREYLVQVILTVGIAAFATLGTQLPVLASSSSDPSVVTPLDFAATPYPGDVNAPAWWVATSGAKGTVEGVGPFSGGSALLPFVAPKAWMSRRLLSSDEDWIGTRMFAPRNWPVSIPHAPVPVNLTHGLPWDRSVPAPKTNKDFGHLLLKLRARGNASVGAMMPTYGLRTTDFTIMYNGTMPRILPALLSTFNTLLVRDITLGSNRSCAGVGDAHKVPHAWACGNHSAFRAVAHPLPVSAAVSGTNVVVAILFASYISIAFISAPAVFAGRAIKERESGSRVVQRVCGISDGAYWLGFNMFDSALSFVSALFVFLFALTSGNWIFQGQLLYGATGLLLSFAGFAIGAPSFGYAFSTWFTTHTTGQRIISITSIFLTYLTGWLAVVLALVKSGSLITGIIRAVITTLFPTFGLTSGIVTTVLSARCYYDSESGCSPSNLLAWDRLGPVLLGSIAASTIYLAITVASEGRPNGLCGQGPLSPPPPSPAPASPPVPPSGAPSAPTARLAMQGAFIAPGEEDEDVMAERGIVHMMASPAHQPGLPGWAMEAASTAGDIWEGGQHPALMMRHVNKTFKSRNKFTVAVRDQCLRVREGECFGLLGPNGAGKSTSLGMVTRSVPPTSGAIWLAGFPITGSQAQSRAFLNTGYCPQANALFEPLSVRQNILLFARIRGLEPGNAAHEVDVLARALDLDPHLDTPFGKCSGGTQRRACLAVCLVGGPSVVLLDEVSTGLDPGARRKLWRVVRALRQAGSTVVVTTHMLSEAEAVCDRVGIMVNGALACLGSPQRITARYGTGLHLELSVNLARFADAPRPANPRALAESLHPLLSNEGRDAEAAADEARARAAREHAGSGGGGGGTSCCFRRTVGPGASGVAGERTATERRADIYTLYDTATTPALAAHAAVARFVREALSPSAELEEWHGGHWRWTIPMRTQTGAPIRLSAVFEAVEGVRPLLGVRDYALSQTSLEQVFLTLAKRQK